MHIFREVWATKEVLCAKANEEGERKVGGIEQNVLIYREFD